MKFTGDEHKGFGLYAEKDFDNGEIVCDYHGRYLNQEQFDLMNREEEASGVNNN